MKLTDRQINASILAIARESKVDFWSMSSEEKTSFGRETWWWFGQLVDQLPAVPVARGLYDEYSEIVRNVATTYVMGFVRQVNPQAKEMPDEQLINYIKTSDIDSQSALFMQLGTVGITAAQEAQEMEEELTEFSSIDFDAELQKLLAGE